MVLLGRVDDAHAAFAKRPYQPIRTERRAGRVVFNIDAIGLV